MYKDFVCIVVLIHLCNAYTDFIPSMNVVCYDKIAQSCVFDTRRETALAKPSTSIFATVRHCVIHGI